MLESFPPSLCIHPHQTRWLREKLSPYQHKSSDLAYVCQQSLFFYQRCFHQLVSICLPHFSKQIPLIRKIPKDSHTTCMLSRTCPHFFLSLLPSSFLLRPRPWHVGLSPSSLSYDRDVDVFKSTSSSPSSGTRRRSCSTNHISQLRASRTTKLKK